MLTPPKGLAWLQDSAGGRRWLSQLPVLVAEVAERWSLRVEEPFADASASLAMPATLPDGTRAVLKLAFPHRESRYEAEALAEWDGDGAVRLLAHDPVRHGLLLERCILGSPLSELEADAALSVFIQLLPRLWKPAGPPFPSLADEAGRWARDLSERGESAARPLPRALLDAALDALAFLRGTQGEQVLVNQDLHAGNVLRARRQPWLVIDPKPLVGEREFGIAAIVRGRELGHSRDAVLRRLDRLTTELGLDRDRARAWALAHTLAWSFEGDTVLTGLVEVAGWLLEGS